MGRPRKLKDEGSVVVEEPGKTTEKVRYQKYEGAESLPPYDEKLSNTFKYSRFFVTGYKNSTMKLIRVYRGGRKDKEGKMVPGPIKHQLVGTFKPLNKKKPKEVALYNQLKSDGLILE